jgi:hypothetical protein
MLRDGLIITRVVLMVGWLDMHMHIGGNIYEWGRERK